jgi:threonine/homoserine/homoserine lactone efflux protein
MIMIATAFMTVVLTALALALSPGAANLFELSRKPRPR